MADSQDRPGPLPDSPEDTVTYALLASAVDGRAAAIVANDADRIAALMAHGWGIVPESGITDRATFLARVTSGDPTHSAMRAATPPRIRVHGDTASVTARSTETAHHGGDRFDADEGTTDVLVRRGGHRRCVLTPITSAAPPEGS
ncbi:nuclear transport factor 2 family protein [Streptomyces sp. NPDC056007]|uniref:nuclear transport factor 2 family protein n=1 Tax=Streptomyces sp. NPDC056007 TaxID=3345678 RepID=UPI0035D923BB